MIDDGADITQLDEMPTGMGVDTPKGAGSTPTPTNKQTLAFYRLSAYLTLIFYIFTGCTNIQLSLMRMRRNSRFSTDIISRRR